MGAWGHRNFENDSALDFVGEFRDEPSEVLLLETLTIVVEQGEEGDFIDADEASPALAAAELVAAALGQPAADLPEGLQKLIDSLDIGDDEELPELARRAVTQVLRESELRELWAENGEPNEWQAVQQDLLARLAE